MKRKHKNLIQLGILAALSFLVILSLFIRDISWPEKAERRVEISVIVRESDSSIWSEARRGMGKAAADYGVELRFLALGESNSVSEQTELIRQEIKNGADGLVVVPAQTEALEVIAKDNPKIPIVTMESSLEGSCISVIPDNVWIGEQLAAAIEEDFSEGHVLLVDAAPGSSGIRARLKAAEESLTEKGFTVLRCGSDFTVETIEGVDAVIFPEPESAVHALQLLDQNGKTSSLYVAGTEERILAGLEYGVIRGVVAWSGYGVGYQAVEQAASAVLGKEISEPVVESVLVRKEEMYEIENQKILFPIDH